MDLKKFLKISNQKPTPWAYRNGIEPVIILRFLNGTRGLSAQTMAKIVEATGGAVSYEDLIAEMRERQAARAREQDGNVGSNGSRDPAHS